MAGRSWRSVAGRKGAGTALYCRRVSQAVDSAPRNEARGVVKMELKVDIALIENRLGEFFMMSRKLIDIMFHMRIS